MRESTLESKCHEYVKRGHRGRMPKWTAPGWEGVPDRILLLPRCTPVFIEFKRPGETRLRAAQGRWRSWLQANGYTHWVINDIDDFIERVVQHVRSQRHE